MKTVNVGQQRLQQRAVTRRGERDDLAVLVEREQRGGVRGKELGVRDHDEGGVAQTRHGGGDGDCAVLAVHPCEGGDPTDSS